MKAENLDVQLLLDPEEPIGAVMIEEKVRLIHIWSERVQLLSHMKPFGTLMESADNMDRCAYIRDNGNIKTIIDWSSDTVLRSIVRSCIQNEVTMLNEDGSARAPASKETRLVLADLGTTYGFTEGALHKGIRRHLDAIVTWYLQLRGKEMPDDLWEDEDA
jgi:hypothetical protein